MTFDELVAQVILYTNREDLGWLSAGGDNQIPQILLSTTTAVHTQALFLKDVVESDIVFPIPNYYQNLDTTSLERYRSLYYIRKWDIQEGTMDPAGNLADSYGAFGNLYPYPVITPSNLIDPLTGQRISTAYQYKMLEIVDTKSMFDSYNLVKTDICYAAGTAIRIKSSTLLTVGKIGYYQYPSQDISNNGENWSSWVADTFPWAIIWNAVAMVFAAIGDVESAKSLLRPTNPRSGDPGGLAAQANTALLMANIELGGR